MEKPLTGEGHQPFLLSCESTARAPERVDLAQPGSDPHASRNGPSHPEPVHRTSLYYHLKPWIPFAVRLTLRRWLARWKRSRAGRTWPILPGSEVPPLGWRGWPDGKRFAVVMTHDVEGQEGVEKCLPLMEIEKAAGFRSSF